jgi:hypothetical protein
MFNIMRELQHATTDIDVRIKTKAQKQAEVIRFNNLVILLTQWFGCTERSLEITANSCVSVDELLNIANKSDIVCTRTDINLRLSHSIMKDTQGLPHQVCYRAISRRLVERLEERKHAIPVDNASVSCSR